jgi:hypothetical protein
MESPLRLFAAPEYNLPELKLKKCRQKATAQQNKNGWMLVDWEAFGGFFNLRLREAAGRLGRIGHGPG